MKKLTLVLLTVILFVTSNSNAAETSKDAWKAYGEKNYTEAVKIFKSLALNGDEEAQFDLGAMYQDGRVIKQDYIEAIKWFRLAAAQNTSFASLSQLKLGEMYANGQGVSQNYAEAIKWFKLSESPRLD